MKTYPAGKLPPAELSRLLAAYTHRHERLLVPPTVGEDAAVIDCGDRLLVAKTDPITFASDEIGWYAVHVNANDIAAMGATPRFFLSTILLPAERATPELRNPFSAPSTKPPMTWTSPSAAATPR